MTLPTYREWSPTSVDCRGLGLPDRQDWLVAPVIRTRDSDCLERSNWTVVTEDFEKTRPCQDTLEAQCNPDPTDYPQDFETYRFNHWGPGWFEICLVRPGTPCAARAQEWANRLESYPIANEDHFSDLEYTEACETWRGMSYHHRRETGATREQARRQALPDNQQVWDYLTQP